MGVRPAAGRELRLGATVAVASMVEGGGGSSSDAPGLAEEADEPCGLSAAQLVEATGPSEETMEGANVTRRCWGLRPEVAGTGRVLEVPEDDCWEAYRLRIAPGRESREEGSSSVSTYGRRLSIHVCACH